MPKYGLILAVIVLTLATLCAAEEVNLLRNAGFEQRASADAPPVSWALVNNQQPLLFAESAHAGEVAAVIPGDGVARAWRQTVSGVGELKHFRLSAFVRAEDVHFASGERAHLYGHIIYKDRPYKDATHFYWKIRPGAYDWLQVAKTVKTKAAYEISHIYVTVSGQFSRGRFLIDDVALTEAPDESPPALLRRKIEDLQAQLQCVGPVDATIDIARSHLITALWHLESTPADLSLARSYWHSAAQSLSRAAWAAMFPQAMPPADITHEARMLYHGTAPTKEGCDRNLDKITAANCNAVLLSLGSWNSVLYPSRLAGPIKAYADEAVDGFDALAYFIDAAHARGVKVYAYIACFNGVDKKHLTPQALAGHTEWLASGPDPAMPAFPDPANPAVVKHMADMYAELAGNYPLDGVGLDYIRYPTTTALNYDQRNRQAIRDRYGIDILADPAGVTDPDDWKKVREYRCEQVAQAVATICTAVRRVAPQQRIIASLFSEPAWAWQHGQDWPTWGKLLDDASPMNYGMVGLNEQLLTRQRDICADQNTRYIPAIGGMGPIHARWTLSEWARYVAVQRRVGCDGIIIYRLGEFDPAVAAFFGKGPFSGCVDFPTSLK